MFSAFCPAAPTFWGEILRWAILVGVGLTALSFVGLAAAESRLNAPPILAQATSNPPLSQAQANRGESAYRLQCGECHGVRLNGGMGPALVGDPFVRKWQGRPASELFAFLKESMPLGLAGTLPDEVYADITVHLLRGNGAATVEAAADTTIEGLRQLTMP